MSRPKITSVTLDNGTVVPVPDTFTGVLRVAVAKYMDDIEHTDIGDKLRHDLPTLASLRDTYVETARSSFYADSANLKCVHCGNPVNNECPDLVCLKCSRRVEYMHTKSVEFCQETCTQTSMENCQAYKDFTETKQ